MISRIHKGYVKINRFVISIQPLRLTLDNYYIYFIALIRERENAALLAMESRSPICSIIGSCKT